MFAIIAKIATKTALIAVVTTAVLALFANIQIPAIDFTLITNALGVGLAVVYHWFPPAQVLMPIVLFLIGLDLALITFNFAMIAIRWIFKVNE